jgi:REP element-mobilizing transposase RayT
MPNHVHILATVHVGISLKELIGPWKGTSTWAINRQMQRSGKLWQDDYFDRLVRDGDHFASCVRYIRRNPEKAKLREGEYTLYESDLARLFAERR